MTPSKTELTLKTQKVRWDQIGPFQRAIHVVQNKGGRGGGRQGKGKGMSTLQKGAILQMGLNTFVPHCNLSLFTVQCLVLPKQ